MKIDMSSYSCTWSPRIFFLDASKTFSSAKEHVSSATLVSCNQGSIKFLEMKNCAKLRGKNAIITEINIRTQQTMKTTLSFVPRLAGVGRWPLCCSTFCESVSVRSLLLSCTGCGCFEPHFCDIRFSSSFFPALCTTQLAPMSRDLTIRGCNRIDCEIVERPAVPGQAHRHFWDLETRTQSLGFFG